MGRDTLSANIELGHKADGRTYDIASLILHDLGVNSIIMMTNNPNKLKAMVKAGITVTERIGMIPDSWGGGWVDRDMYLLTKSQKMGHLITVPDHVLNRIHNRTNADKNNRILEHIVSLEQDEPKITNQIATQLKEELLELNKGNEDTVEKDQVIKKSCHRQYNSSPVGYYKDTSPLANERL